MSAAKTAAPVAQKPRDTTRAINLANRLAGAMQALVPDSTSYLHADARALITILEDMDARTGKRDPSKRKKPAAKKKVTR